MQTHAAKDKEQWVREFFLENPKATIHDAAREAAEHGWGVPPNVVTRIRREVRQLLAAKPPPPPLALATDKPPPNLPPPRIRRPDAPKPGELSEYERTLEPVPFRFQLRAAAMPAENDTEQEAAPEPAPAVPASPEVPASVVAELQEAQANNPKSPENARARARAFEDIMLERPGLDVDDALRELRRRFGMGIDKRLACEIARTVREVTAQAPNAVQLLAKGADRRGQRRLFLKAFEELLRADPTAAVHVLHERAREQTGVRGVALPKCLAVAKRIRRELGVRAGGGRKSSARALHSPRTDAAAAEAFKPLADVTELVSFAARGMRDHGIQVLTIEVDGGEVRFETTMRRSDTGRLTLDL